jgi:hypothetical protein
MNAENEEILNVCLPFGELLLVNLISKQGAYHGALGVVKSAIKVGIKKIIVTSTMGALIERKLLFCPVTI